MILIGQTKRLDALSAMQNKSALNIVSFLKKSRKTFKWHFLEKLVFLLVYLDFSETVLCRELICFVLHSVHQDASFELSKSLI